MISSIRHFKKNEIGTLVLVKINHVQFFFSIRFELVSLISFNERIKNKILKKANKAEISVCMHSAGNFSLSLIPF
jgi:hypothetical protein